MLTLSHRCGLGLMWGNLLYTMCLSNVTARSYDWA
jgi:hypothetical protein